MRIYAISEKGNHEENEDRILINNRIVVEDSFFIECEEAKVFIADGVGGNNAGAVAANFVCDNLRTCDSINEDTFFNINMALIEKSKENPAYEKMATTLSGVLLNKDDFKLFHVGNTRVYIFQGNYLKQITEDHTSVNWLLKIGKISKTDAENYDKRNEITACFGGSNSSLINSMVFDDNNISLINAQRIIMTSDGIHEYLTIDEMEEILNSEDSSHLNVCKKMIDKANLNGSEDDKSIVIIYR